MIDANTGEKIDADTAIDQDILFIKELIDGPQGDKPMPGSQPALEDDKWCYEGRPEEKSFLFEVKVHFQRLRMNKPLELLDLYSFCCISSQMQHMHTSTHTIICVYRLLLTREMGLMWIGGTTSRGTAITLESHAFLT